MIIRRHCLAAVVAAVLAGGAGAAEAQAQPAYRLSIDALPMDEALNEFARQSGLQIVLQTEEVRGLRAPKLEGTLTARDALRKLLADSGLAYEYLNEHTVAVRTAKHGAGLNEPETRRPATLKLAQAPGPRPQDTTGDSRPATAPAEPTIVSLDEILVTGTRIRGVEESASAVYTFDREDFAESGATTVQALMRTLPQNFTGGPSETGGMLASSRNGGAGNGGFGAGINLRGLGSASTLVLLNGRRMAPVGHAGFVDVSTIPLSALERIDVLPDGASAVYGSDAVGGVVNFVLREDYEGFETTAGYGTVTDGGLRELTASQLVGVNWGSGSVLFDLDYARRDPLLASDRDYASALARGVTYLTPDEERLSALLRVRQDLSDNVSLAATAYATNRDAGYDTYILFQQRQYFGTGTTEQSGGTLELSWDASETWTVNLAQTFTKMHVERDGRLLATQVLPAQTAYSAGDQSMSATELEGEGRLFAAPGGDARLAIGAEHRREKFDEVNVPGALSPRDTSAFERKVSSAYAEVFVPLIGAQNRMDMARRLDVTAAVRYEDYDDVGSSDTWKFGVLWSPTDGFNLRATHGTSFRAPYLFQLQDAQGFAYLLNAPNPAAPGGSTLVAMISQVPASDLGPENARIWTAGLDLEPSLLAGFSARATYFDIDYEDRITAARLSPTPFTDPALVGVVSTPADPAVLAQIADLPPSRIYRLGGVTAPISAAEATLDGRTRNQSRTTVSGIDLVVERAFATGIGDFNVGLNTTYLLSFETQQLDTTPARDVLNTIFNPIELRARAFASYSHAGWKLSAAFNYTDDYVDNQARPFVAVSSWSTIDLALAYEFSEPNWLKGLTLRANALNVFDRDPPKVLDREPAWGNPGFDTENANPLGRMIMLQAVKSW